MVGGWKIENFIIAVGEECTLMMLGAINLKMEESQQPDR